MEQRTSLTEIIEYINPGDLNYQEWINVGMALKQEGYSMDCWDAWSRRDSGRYHAGECAKKWKSFSGSSSPVTGGTIVQMALDHGWVPERGHELEWDDMIQNDDHVIVNKEWLEGMELQEPQEWNPAAELVRYRQPVPRRSGHDRCVLCFEVHEPDQLLRRSDHGIRGLFRPGLLDL